MKMSIEEQNEWLHENKDRIIRFHRQMWIDMSKEYSDHAGENWSDEFIQNRADEMMKDYDFETAIHETYKYCGEMANDDESINRINLHDYLESIRHNDYETFVFLFIRDGKIVHKEEIKGVSTHVGTLEDIERMVKIATKLHAEIFDFHNHPIRLNAYQSKGDIQFAKESRKIADKYNVKYIGHGVVTNFDFCKKKEDD